MEIVEQFVVSAPRGRVFRQIASVEGMALFSGFGMIPGIERVESEGEVRGEGAVDFVYNTDGTCHRERVTELSAPSAYALRIGPFSSPMKRLVDHLDERWELEEVDRGTRVRRRVRFAVRGLLSSLVIRLVIAPQMRVAMRRNHAALAHALDSRI